MSAYEFKVGGDFQELLRGFDRIDQRAQQSGQAIGKGIDEGVKQGQRSAGQLLSEIKSLKVTKATLPVDSSEYKAAEARIKELGAAIGDLNRQRAQSKGDAGAQQMGESARRAAGDFNFLRAAVEGVAFSITNVLADGLLTLGRASVQSVSRTVQEFASLDTELRKAAAADGGAGAYEKLAATVDRVGIDAAGTALEVAQLTTELVRGGLTVDQVNDSLGAIVRGAEATGTGFERMGANVAAALKIFGLPATEATRVVDALTQAANISAASVEGLGYGLSYAGPVAKQLGVSVEELGIALGLLTNAGIDASSAGVTLRNGFSKLASAAPSAGGATQGMTRQVDLAAKAMKRLGVDIYEADGTLRPMETVLLRLRTAFQSLGPAAKIRLASDLFGGEDDGAKWLALLDQSEEEIRRMSAAMANTKGATDKARDAMQGFEMELKKLDGTVGSITTGFGGVAAAALLPLAQLANVVAGAISGLPAPLKTAAAAAVLLTGSLVAARVAMVVFNQALGVSQVQAAIEGFRNLGTAIRTGLAADLARGATAFRSFTAAAATASAVSVSTAGGTALAGIAGAATVAANAVKGLGAAITSGTLLSGIKALAAGGAATLAGWAPLLPLAALVGLVAANVAIWSKVTERAKGVSEAFAGSQKQAAKALREVGIAAKESRNPVEQLTDAIVKRIRVTAAANAFRTLAKESEELQGKFDAVQRPALAFLRTLQGNKKVTAEAKARAGQYATSLDGLANAGRKTAEGLRAQAEEAAKAGSPELAVTLRDQARAFDVNASSATAQATALRRSAGITTQKTAATKVDTAATNAAADAEKRLQQAEKRRQDFASATATQGQTAITNREAAFAITKEQADEERRLLQIKDLQLEREQQIKRARTDTDPNNRADATNKVAQIEGQIAQLRLQGAQLEVSKQQRIFELAQGRLQIEQQRVALEDRASQLVSARLRDQQQVLDAQLALQQAQQGLTDSLFGVDRARQQFALTTAEAELQRLQKRNAGAGDIARQEERIAALKLGAADIDRRALEAQITAAAQRFDLERQVLQLKQAQEVLDAQAAQRAAAGAALEARKGLLELQGKALDPNLTAGQRGNVQQQIQAQTSVLVLAERQQQAEAGRLQILNAVFGLQNRALQAQQQTTVNGFRAQAAAQGWEQSLGGSLSSLDQAAGTTRSVASSVQEIGGGFITVGGQTVQIAGAVDDIAAASANAADSAATLATGYADANTQAQALLGTLQRIAATPQARWSGGPVEPGSSYRINELGQEALLAGGRLSLINAPARSLWRPPARGTVLPAGLTSRLKDAGAFDRTMAAGSIRTGNLEGEIAALRMEISALRRKDMSLQVVLPSNAGLLRSVQGI